MLGPDAMKRQATFNHVYEEFFGVRFLGRIRPGLDIAMTEDLAEKRLMQRANLDEPLRIY